MATPMVETSHYKKCRKEFIDSGGFNLRNREAEEDKHDHELFMFIKTKLSGSKNLNEISQEFFTKECLDHVCSVILSPRSFQSRRFLEHIRKLAGMDYSKRYFSE